MAKKKQTKKHKFKYAAPTAGVGAPIAVANEPAAIPASRPVKSRPSQTQTGVVTRNFTYVGHDVRRVAIFAGGLIGVELILWWSFGHTGLGNAVYNLVHV